jgi:hypothetical protein
MSATLSVRDLRIKVAEATTVIEKLTREIELYEKLPLIHDSLQGKIRALARVLLFLQMNAYGNQNENAVEKEKAILEEDLLSIEVIVGN